MLAAEDSRMMIVESITSALEMSAEEYALSAEVDQRGMRAV